MEYSRLVMADGAPGFKRTYTLLVYFLMCSIGLMGAFYHLGVLIGNRIASQLGASLQYYAWVADVIEFGKPGELIGFILPAGCLFMYYAMAILLLNKSHLFAENRSLFEGGVRSRVVSFVLVLAVNLYPLQWWVNMTISDWCVFLIFWMIVHLYVLGIICCTYFPEQAKAGYHAGRKVRSLLVMKFMPDIGACKRILLVIERFLSGFIGKLVGVSLLSMMIIQLWLQFIPYLTKPLYIHNDYLGIPEQTLMGNRYVDNISYINQHRLGGLLENDPRKFNQLPALKSGEDYIKLKQTNELTAFVLRHPSFLYDDHIGGLFVDGLLSDVDVHALCQIVKDKTECTRINEFYKFNQAQATRPYSQDELIFIQKNMYEIGNQLAIGHYFFHHAFLTIPINEYSLGRPSNEISSMYGRGNSMVLAKLANMMGGLNFKNYIQITHVFYPFYYSLIVLAAFLIFGDVWLTVLVSMICFSGLYLVSFEAVYMAPGFNPLRHFFDVFVMVFFYYYLFSNKNKLLYLGLTLFFTALALFCDRAFGLYVVGGLLFALFAKAVLSPKERYLDLGSMALCLCLGVLSMYPFKASVGAEGLYYFLGVMLPFASPGLIGACLMALNIIYLYLIFHQWPDVRWRIYGCYFLGFINLSLVYYIWNPSINHFSSVIFPWAFLLGVMLVAFTRTSVGSGSKNTLVVLLMISVYLFYYEPAFTSYQQSRDVNRDVFKNHKLYFWNMPTAQFYSTMDPAPFENAVNIIRKYEADNGIYIISRYDNSIPFFAAKYSLMPFMHLANNIMTPSEMNLSARAILEKKPKYLFVDTTITGNNRGEIGRKVDPALSVYALGRKRYLAYHQNLGDLFKMVMNDYELLEKGQLISVYKKKHRDA